MSELATQRKLTTAFINTQPINVVLVPRERVKQPTGGFKYVAQTPRTSQVMRLVEPPQIPAPLVTLDGVERVVEFMLLGEWNAVIGVYDTFSHDGRDWEVVSLAHFNGWEQRALVARYG